MTSAKRVKILNGPWKGTNGYIVSELDQTVGVSTNIANVKSVIFVDKIIVKEL